MANADSNYGAADIRVLEGLAAVQKRPAMYVGNTGFEFAPSGLRSGG